MVCYYLNVHFQGQSVKVVQQIHMPCQSHYFLILIPILLKIPKGKFGSQFTKPQTDFMDCWTLKMGALCFSRTGWNHRRLQYSVLWEHHILYCRVLW